MLRPALLSLALISSGAAAAQPFQYSSGWFIAVRDNVLVLQERQRARLEALESRRAQQRALGTAAAVAAPAPVVPAVLAR